MTTRFIALITSVYSVPLGLLVLALFAALAQAALWLRPALRREIEAERAHPAFVPQLEGLRGILAAAVVVFHGVIVFVAFPRLHVWAEVPSNFYAQLGVAPVLMFFFLTGYLFWSKLLRSPHIVLLAYLRARVRRLGPVYAFAMLWLLALVLIESGFHRHAELGTLLRSVLAWLMFTVPGMPDINALPATNLLIAGTPWTLAMEWRFYLLLPLLVWFARKPVRFVWLFPLAFCFYLGFSERFAGRVHSPVLHSLAASTHAMAGHVIWSFGVGIVVAVAHAALRRQNAASAWNANSRVVSLGCVMAAAVVMFGLAPHFLSTAESVLLGGVFFCIVSGNTMWGALSSAPLLLLGRCSYSLYLCHGLLLATAMYALRACGAPALLSGRAAWLAIVLCSIGSFAVSLAVHEFVETPFLVRRRTGLVPLPPEPAAA